VIAMGAELHSEGTVLGGYDGTAVLVHNAFHPDGPDGGDATPRSEITASHAAMSAWTRSREATPHGQTSNSGMQFATRPVSVKHADQAAPAHAKSQSSIQGTANSLATLA